MNHAIFVQTLCFTLKGQTKKKQFTCDCKIAFLCYITCTASGPESMAKIILV